MNWLIEKFRGFNKKKAIIHKGKEYSYQQLSDEIDRCMNDIIVKAISPGEVVSIISDYSFESIALLLALYLDKNIIVPITNEIESEVNERLEESLTEKTVFVKNKIYTVRSRNSKKNHEIINRIRAKKKSGLILFSSGSTGKPKAMIHDFDKFVDHFKSRKPKLLNILLFLMFDHIGGLNTLFSVLSMGATVVIPENRNADDVCRLVQDHNIKVLPSSPTFLNLILMNKSYEKYNLSSLRMITYGTETMPESLIKRLKDIFPKTKFLQTFGTSETGIANTISKSSSSTYMRLDDQNLNHKVVNGELWLKSETQIMGYLNASMECFTGDGWFKTGDLVELLDNGLIKIIGRRKEVINVGGEKVLPNEVESLLLSMDEIRDVMVFGAPNIITGQTVVCELVLGTILTTKEIKKRIRMFCKNKIEQYKIPTKVIIVEKVNFGSRFKKIRRKRL
jgi:acyl-coenzyme A synthetase/AMP-(fatty) acid ligase